MSEVELRQQDNDDGRDCPVSLGLAREARRLGLGLAHVGNQPDVGASSPHRRHQRSPGPRDGSAPTTKLPINSMSTSSLLGPIAEDSIDECKRTRRDRFRRYSSARTSGDYDTSGGDG